MPAQKDEAKKEIVTNQRPVIKRSKGSKKQARSRSKNQNTSHVDVIRRRRRQLASIIITVPQRPMALKRVLTAHFRPSRSGWVFRARASKILL